jgi:hypothetical protein
MPAVKATAEAAAAENAPVKKFRVGNVQVDVWSNPSTQPNMPPMYTVSWQKSYVDQQGAWQSTQSLNLADIPKLRLALAKAYEWILVEARTQ